MNAHESEALIQSIIRRIFYRQYDTYTELIEELT